MKPLIVANWKCNPITAKEAQKIFNSVKRGLKNMKNVEVVVCPPFPYLSVIGGKLSLIKLGGQNCFWEEKGAYTGEVSPKQLLDLGCQYVILGHSERRGYCGETDEMINKKMKIALSAGLKPILCIGETLEQKDRGETRAIQRAQIEKGLAEISEKEIRNVAIAYEPIWAIGTGKPCDASTAFAVSLYIREVVSGLYGQTVAENLQILYGGSANSQNAAEYMRVGMNGLLVGGASLKPKDFVEIIKVVAP